jgi:hypothetical protein
MTNLQTASLAGMALLVSCWTSLAAVSEASAHPTDRLSLSTTQQNTAYHDLFMPPFAQTPPSGFEAIVGAVVPKSIATAPVTSKAAGDVPKLRQYEFAMIKSKLLIVNPLDHKIAEVISSN